jgi:Flp pilus assembly protein TadD
LRKAAQLAPKQAARVVDLAKFLAQRGKIQDSDRAFGEAAKVFPASPLVLFEHAQTLIQQKRRLNEAKAMLEKFLTLPLTPEDPSREDARRLLKATAGA